ncbi:MAG: sigma-70 family RNA polymerase sigma factor [Gloeomargarita sp. GMQP_bins_120]
MNSPAPSDQALLQGIQRGESRAMALLYERYGKLVYSLALRLLQQPQEAEDLTQEVFASLWCRGNYDARRGSVPTYLTTLTRSRGIDRLRMRQSRMRWVQRWGILTAGLTEPPLWEHLSLRERQERVRRALDQLAPEQRQLLEMAYYQGLTQAEIAQQLNLPLGTVKTRTRSILSKLRQLLYDQVL